MEARRFSKLSFEDLIKMKVALKRAKHFITCNGKYYGEKNPLAVRGLLTSVELGENSEQLNLFSVFNADMGGSFEPFVRLSTPQNALRAITGQL
jgi:hypothetical protein